MTNILCANIGCKYNDGSDRCTAKKIRLSWHSVATVNNGRQEYLQCKEYQKSDILISFENFINEQNKRNEG